MMAMMTVYEMCGNCMEENEVETEAGNYISTCKTCGQKLMLCSECYHDGNGKCDWSKEGCYRDGGNE